VSRLFAEVYLDEDVDVAIAYILRARGFGAVTARDAGRLSGTDPEQLAYAVEQQTTLLSHNRADYEALHRQYLEEGRSHWGIIIAVQRRRYEIVVKLIDIIDRLTADELRDQLLYI